MTAAATQKKQISNLPFLTSVLARCFINRLSTSIIANAVRQRANIRGVASTTPADIADAFGFRNATEVGELFSRRLDGLQLVGELGETREAGSFVRSAESGWLSRQRNIDRCAHLA